MTTDAIALSHSSVALSLIGLTTRLIRRFWPQLMALWLVGNLAYNTLTEAAVRIGFVNGLAGLTALTLVVLAKLVITVAMFETVRPGLTALGTAAETTDGDAAPKPRGKGLHQFTTTLTLSLVPFFGYYAAWGFLGDAVRDYSKLSLDLAPFGEKGFILGVSGGWWLVASVALAWLVRRGAKAMRARSEAPIWPIVIVVCEANWMFIGLFVLSHWKGAALAWAATLPELAGRLWNVLAGFGHAQAATIPPPVEAMPQQPFALVKGLFFYALYPVVWLTLAAVVYGYDIHAAAEPSQGRVAQAVARWRSLPGILRDFIGHFVNGTIKRYRALANGVSLTLGIGITLLAMVVVLYRMLDWLAAWAWWGAAQAIGAHDLQLWQILAHGLSMLFGNPSAPGDGLLAEPIKICLLAAALDLSFAGGKPWRRI